MKRLIIDKISQLSTMLLAFILSLYLLATPAFAQNTPPEKLDNIVLKLSPYHEFQFVDYNTETYAKLGTQEPIEPLEALPYNPKPVKDYRLLYVLFASLASIALAFAVARFWNQGLRRAVASSTRELRESNEQVRLLLNSTEESIYGLDLDGNCTWANTACVKTLGYDSQEQLLGENMHNLIHHTRADGSPYPANDCKIYISFKRKNVSHIDDEVFWRADGSSFPAAYRSQQILRDGKVVGLVVTFLDITEQIQAKKEKKRLERQLQHTQKLESLGVLAGGIAHDFNNILTGVLGYAELTLADLNKLENANHTTSYVNEVIKGSKRAADLTRQMLDFSGRGKFIVEAVDISAVTKDTAQFLQTSIPQNITLEMNIDSTLPPINGDSTQIQQVIMNLITNAADSIGEGHGIITLSTSSLWCDKDRLAKNLALAPDDIIQPSGNYIYFKISDTGSGMNEDTQTKIFDPFFSTKFTGRGLGLAAVLGIIRGHNGVITLDTEPGKGSTFHVYFPVGTSIKTPKVLKNETVSKPTTIPSAHTILLVDDETSVRAVTKSILEGHGFNILTAENGAEAIKIFNENYETIHAVFLDLTMPRMSGEECYKALRKIQPDLKVIIMSGFYKEDALKRYTLDGITGFIQKPFNRDKLNTLLHTILES